MFERAKCVINALEVCGGISAKNPAYYSAGSLAGAFVEATKDYDIIVIDFVGKVPEQTFIRMFVKELFKVTNLQTIQQSLKLFNLPKKQLAMFRNATIA